MEIVILGPQGSGKGTQSKLIVDNFDMTHIEMGLILRKLASEDSEIGKRVDETIHIKKELVSDEIVFSQLENATSKALKEKGVIFDGVPRRLAQVKGFEEMTKRYERIVDGVFYIKVPLEESIKRITKRYHCNDCDSRIVLGENIENPVDSCPKCGGTISQRSDDTPEGVKKRLDIFYKETIPVIEYYRKIGILFEIDGQGSPEEVYSRIEKEIKILNERSG